MFQKYKLSRFLLFLCIADSEQFITTMLIYKNATSIAFISQIPDIPNFLLTYSTHTQLICQLEFMLTLYLLLVVSEATLRSRYPI